MAEVWSRTEVEAAVADYFDMLRKELKSETYSKNQHWKALKPKLNNRNSVDRKHQNISAVLIELGYPYISGYKPLWNYQELIRSVVTERVTSDPNLARLVSNVVEREVIHKPSFQTIEQIKPPKPISPEKVTPRIAPTKKNYLEIEAHNRALGLAGEEVVLELERNRLSAAGRADLADKVEHVAITQGDLLGYDIHSFEENGNDRVIEVKTTRFGEMVPFFVSRNEIAVSEKRYLQYHLFRLYDFEKRSGLYVLRGSLRASCKLEPIRFEAFRLH